MKLEVNRVDNEIQLSDLAQGLWAESVGGDLYTSLPEGYALNVTTGVLFHPGYIPDITVTRLKKGDTALFSF